MMFLQSQRTDVFNALQGVGLDPHDFTMTDDPPILRYNVDPRYCFEFHAVAPPVWRLFYGTSPSESLVRFFPSDEHGGFLITRARAWQDKRQLLDRWLDLMRRQAVPDPWTTLEDSDGAFSAAAPTAENTPFTTDELRFVKTELESTKGELRATHGDRLDETQLRAIEERLDYLIDAAPRLGRIDWKNVAAGALLGLALQGLVPSDVMFRLLTALGHTLAPIFGLAPPTALGP